MFYHSVETSKTKNCRTILSTGFISGRVNFNRKKCSISFQRITFLNVFFAAAMKYYCKNILSKYLNQSIFFSISHVFVKGHAQSHTWGHGMCVIGRQSAEVTNDFSHVHPSFQRA